MARATVLLRRAAPIAGAVLVVAAVVAVLAWVSVGGSGDSAGAAPPATGMSSGAGNTSSSGPSRAPSSSSGPSRGPSSSSSGSAAPPPISAGVRDDAGGLAAARAQVDKFVTAMNRGDTAAANALLCTAMAGWYGPGSLQGIKDGSFDVGGVRINGTRGSALVTYRTTPSGTGGEALYTLVLESGTWRMCSQR